MFETRITKMLGIKYPIVLAPMAFVSEPHLVSAVSNTGGLGVLAAAFISAEEVRRQIKETKTLTDFPFGVNIPLATPNLNEAFDVLIEEDVKIVYTSAGSPVNLIQGIKDAGMTHMHVVPTSKLAKKIEDLGVDIIIAEGGEAGGMLPSNPVSTMTLVPQVVDAVKVPVIAAGGIADGRGLVAALSLGAEGVLIGTRFIASKEAKVHENYKKAIINAKDNDTLLKKIGIASARVLRNQLVNKMEEDINLFEQLKSSKRALEEGDIENSILAMGQSSGLVKEIKSVREIINEIINEAKNIMKRLTDLNITLS
ncbi:MAG: NAD(P)H-dependent flavin oxidoreductase [Candidatus Lokiarchaeia archaeon]